MGILLLAVLLLVSVLPAARGDVDLEFQFQTSDSGVAAMAPLSAATTSAGVGGCASTATGTVPFAVGSARGSVAVAEPHGCPTRTRLVFLPALRFPNGLPTPFGHQLTVRLDLVSFSGTTTMARNVQSYVQTVGGGNPIVTTTHLVIRFGVVVTSSTSSANLATGTTYGLGIRMTLNLQPAVSSITLGIVLAAFLDDAGTVRALEQEFLTVTITY